jgi:hypothetical protein
MIGIAPPGLITLNGLNQGSQSLALGLTLTAASQLVEGSRLRKDDATRNRYLPLLRMSFCRVSSGETDSRRFLWRHYYPFEVATSLCQWRNFYNEAAEDG